MPEPTAVLQEMNRRLGSDWQLVQQLPGGWNQGAYLVAAASGQRAVLKWAGDGASRALSVAPEVVRARAAGWPIPAWLAAIRLDDQGAAWLQEYLPGQRPAELDHTLASRVGDLLERQRGLRPATGADWSDWVRGSVVEDWHGMRARVAAHFPRGERLVALADRIARTCGDTELPCGDLVHGNLCLDNLLITDDGRLAAVDVQSLGRGSRVYDAVGVLLTTAAFGESTPAGRQHLERYAIETAGPAVLAMCAASTALSTAEAFLRLARAGEAPAAAPGIVQFLAHCADLAS
jgi:aminoglycoside phosphotransferase (APT) family kinase protein